MHPVAMCKNAHLSEITEFSFAIELGKSITK